ncbi:hypothetical protein FRC02_010152 [Tulasnella sp. 418]|nr:hypothetical protein FRC02_010152 [Tulasnella sp. 418]
MPLFPLVIPENEKLPQDVNLWSRDNVQMFLEANKDKYDLDAKHIHTLKENEVTGLGLLGLTEEELETTYGLKPGAATVVTKIVEQLKVVKEIGQPPTAEADQQSKKRRKRQGSDEEESEEDQQSKKRRKRQGSDEEESDTGGFKRPKYEEEQLKLVTNEIANSMAPSSAAQTRNFRRLQTDAKGKAILCGRPHTNTGLPIEIYHPAFGQFQKDVRDTTRPLDPIDIQRTHDFMIESTSFHKNKQDRTYALKGLLGSLLEFPIGDHINRDNTHADGVIKLAVPSGACAFLLIIEMKNEIGEGNSDPFHQGALSYRRSWCFQDFYKRSCCPTFILSIAGPWICISGGILLDKVVVQPLTKYEWTGYGNNQNVQVRSLARLFRALSSGISSLRQYYSPLFDGQSPDPNRIYPAVRTFPTGPSLETFTTFEYTGQLYAPKSTPKPVFRAKAGTQELVIKFTYQYNKAAHDLLAQQGLAPRLLYVDPALDTLNYNVDVHGLGPWMVVMEYVGSCLPKATLSEDDKPRIIKAIESAINMLHDEGWVFGDLRPVNVMINKNKGIYLVDFDWCGRHSEARYPECINISGAIKWHKDVKPVSLMKKEHDEFMLWQLKEYLC